MPLVGAEFQGVELANVSVQVAVPVVLAIFKDAKSSLSASPSMAALILAMAIKLFHGLITITLFERYFHSACTCIIPVTKATGGG